MATLATDKSIFQIKSLHRSARTLCLILALVSNISVRCSLDHTVLMSRRRGCNRRVTDGHGDACIPRQGHTRVSRIVVVLSLYNIAIDRRSV